MIDFVNKYKDIFYFKILQLNLRGCASVLDVGCGSLSPLSRVEKKFKSTGIDGYQPSIEKSKKQKIHDFYVLGNINKLRNYFKTKSFDVVIALDVIEHFQKEEAYKIIKDMEFIAKKKVIILTPNGFYPQDKFEGNPYQIHKSGWTKMDLENLGYRVCGLRGLKWIRGDFATIKYKPWIIWGIIAFFSEPLFFLFPDLSYDLFAVKDLREKRNNYQVENQS